MILRRGIYMSTKQKMETRRRKKRKSPSHNIIFEVSDNDMSPETSSNEDSGPEAKISKIEVTDVQTKDSNLETDTTQLKSVGNSSECNLANEDNGSNGAIDKDKSCNKVTNEKDILSKPCTNDIDDSMNSLEKEEAASTVGLEDETIVIIADEKSDSTENHKTILVETDKTVSNNTVIDLDKTVFTDETVLPDSDKTVFTDETVVLDSDKTVFADETVLLDSDKTVFTDETVLLESDKTVSTDETVLLDSDKTVFTDETVLLESDKLLDNDKTMFIDNVKLTEIETDDMVIVEKEDIIANDDDKLSIVEINDSITNEQSDSQTEIDSSVIIVNDLSSVDVEASKSCEDDNENRQFIQITFSNKQMSNLYKEKMLKYMKNFIELEIKSDDDLTVQIQRDEFLCPSDWVVLDETKGAASEKDISVINLVTPDCTPVKKRKKKNKSKKNKEVELFTVDTNPSEENGSLQLKYSSRFMIDSGEKVQQDMKISTLTCFNCDGSHNLKDCPKPKDFGKINAARKRIAQSKSARYHLEDDQRFGHLVPGQISDSLRKAMGLQKNQLPHYIYLMRNLGYPPGWLEEAKFVHSNLTMYDIDGKNVKNRKTAKHGLDPEKIIEYSGFNVPLEKGFKDEFRKYGNGIRPYSEEFSKDAMLNFYEKQFLSQEDNLNAADMDIDGSDDETNPTVTRVKESLIDISLNTLEMQKQKLLEELNKSLDTTVAEEPEGSSEDANSEQKQEEPPIKSVVETNYGTPILKSASPYLRLPNPDNFSKDVSPVINFENLPNSTGKYEQMTGVIQKVRTTLKTLQNCNS